MWWNSKFSIMQFCAVIQISICRDYSLSVVTILLICTGE